MKTLTLCILGFPYLVHAAELLIRDKQIKRALRKVAIVGFIAAGLTHFGEALHSVTYDQKTQVMLEQPRQTDVEYPDTHAWQIATP